MKDLKALIHSENWAEVTGNYSSETVANQLSFEEGLVVACAILMNEERDDDLREYAVDMIKYIRKTHPNEWNKDWRNDKFLGDACDIAMRYDEMYEAYRRAYKLANPPPPSILLSLAMCYHSPGKPPVTVQEAESLVTQALQQFRSKNAVRLMCNICLAKNDKAGASYWEQVLDSDAMEDDYGQDWPNFLC